MTGALFACDLATIELFLDAIGEKQIRWDVNLGTFELVPAPTRSNALDNEISASVVPFIRHAWYGAVVIPGKPPSRPFACDACGSWTLRTVQRSKALCPCGAKGLRLLEIPWADANHHNRPKPPKGKQ